MILCFISTVKFTQEISLVASNNVSDDRIMHTLKLTTNNLDNAYNDDELSPIPLNKKIQDFIAFVENKNGVIRITYDRATNSFSILSNLKFNIQQLINTNNPLNISIE